ncbi:hypothetical protein EI94DRAFT_1832004 [Lactarius quietus]|nr:hypothetical protein EI94DRAFT_1832004 [Lactarius quietus]
MDGSRVLFHHCGPLMNEVDRLNFRNSYDQETDARETLDGDVSGYRKWKGAKKFFRLSEKTYDDGKRGSDRALDNLLVRGSGGTDPPGASPATPEESDDTDTSAGEGSSDTDTSPGTPPSTPEEPDRSLPYDRRSTVSHPAATSSIAEWVQNIETTPSSRSRCLATSGTTIASYQTEKTVNSRKSRYNTRPRHKYADHGYLRPQGFASLDVDEASIAETELSDEHEEPPSSPLTPTVSPQSELAQEGESSNVDVLDRS